MNNHSDRRNFLKQLLAAGSIAWLTGGDAIGGEVLGGYARPVPFTQNPFNQSAPQTLDRGLFEIEPGRDPAAVFTLSVASGDPREHGVVIWTRIDPQAVTNTNPPIAYQIASQSSFATQSILVEGLA